MKNIDAVAQAVSRDDYKKSVHVTEDDIDDDDLFDLYLQGAQEVVEAATRRPMTQRSVEFQCRATGWRRWWFPVAPVADVTAIAWQNEAGAWVDLGVSGIRIEQAFDEPQLIVPASFFSTVTDGAAIRITATVGHEVADRPRQLAQAVIMIVKDWFEAGIAIEKKEFLDVSFGCRALIKQVRYVRPFEYAPS
jgi:uncharacterized phiE125 gp8 family phage protein